MPSMKKILCFISFLCLVLMLFSAACGEAPASGTPSIAAPEASPAPTPAATEDYINPSTLVFINRIKDPSLSFPFDEKDESLLHIWFPNVFSADAALISCGGENVLIDCASRAQGVRVAKMLAMLGIDHIDKVLNSHPHNDHILGFESVAGTAAVDELWIGFHDFYTDHMAHITRYCNKNEIPVHRFFDGDTFTVGGAQIDVMMKGDVNWDLNNRSAVMRLTYGDRSALFTGDISTEAQKRLMETVGAEGLRADILKYPHHMAAFAVEDFIRMVDPGFIAITNTTFYAVRPKPIELMHIDYAYTPSGYLHFVTDGSMWGVELLQESEMPFPDAALVFTETEEITDGPMQESDEYMVTDEAVE